MKSKPTAQQMEQLQHTSSLINKAEKATTELSI